MFTALQKWLFPEKVCYFRLGFVAAREGHIAEILCSIHETQETPMPAVLVQVLLCIWHIFSYFDQLLLREVVLFILVV